MPEMTETQKTPGRKPKKKKNKESHNAVERHRKEKINAGINRIGSLLPCSQALKQSKNNILDQAFRYITELKKQNDTLLLESGDKVQAEEIRRLRRQLEELRKESAHYIELLKANDISLLEDPTIHWKGKQSCAKVAKVTPTHQLPKGIVVYSNGNVMRPAGKQKSPVKRLSETLVLPTPDEAGVRVNGALLQVKASSSTPALLPVSAATPSQAAPALRVIEQQCVVETPAAAPALPPSVSYITLQIPAAATSLPQPTQPAAPAQPIAIAATSASQHPAESIAPLVLSHATFTQTVTRPAASGVCSSVTADTTIGTVSYTAVPSTQTLLRAGAAGSTQTTWTTLQMTGNTVQPVCQSLPPPEVSSTTQAVQHVTVCPKPPVCPIQIHMQPYMPVQQTPIAGHLQTHTLLKPPAVPNQPQCAVLSQPALVPHPAVVSQPQPTVLQPASLVPHPPAALISQPQPALVPQPQAAVLPLLQTMQVLQVNPAAAAASGVTASQNTNNPSLVILQQASACPSQPVVREEMTNQTPCQHIVIIQAPSQAASAPQTPQVGMVPAAAPAASTQTPTTSSPVPAPPVQSVGGKQLVHILPRPTQPSVNHPRSVSQASSSPPVPTTPQTITVNGQVFALQPMKTSDKSSSQGGQSTLQLVQPTTTEEPTTNVALNSLGALSSLNQSISQGLPLSSQSSCQPPAPESISGATLALPAQQLQLPGVNPVTSGQAAKASKPSGKKLRSVLNTKKAAAKRTKPAKKKVLSPAQVAVVSAAGEQTAEVLPPSTVKVTDLLPACSTNVTKRSEAVCVESAQNIVGSSSSDAAVFSPPEEKSSVGSSQSGLSQAVTSDVTNAANVSETSAKSSESKPASVSDGSTVNKHPICAAAPSKLPIPAADSKTTALDVSAAVAEVQNTSAGSSTLCSNQACTSSLTTTAPVTLNQNALMVPSRLSLESKTQNPSVCNKPDSQSTAPFSVSTTSAPDVEYSAPQSSVAAGLEFRKKNTTPRAPLQQTEVTGPQMSSCHPAEVKPAQATMEERHSTSADKASLVVAAASEAPSQKDFALSQQVYTNLDDQSLENPNGQTDSPTSGGAGGGRGFSVASMLPQGQSIGGSSGSFGTFTFTSEQAEMLAFAMLEQDSPGRRSGGCSVDNAPSVVATTASWDSSKPPAVSTGKDRGSAGQQAKMTKPMDPGTLTHAEMSVRGQAGDVSISGPNGSRNPQNIVYSQPQALQSQSSVQSGTAATLSVNNLIRPSSNHPPYPSSPNLTVQQGSVPSPVGASAHMSQAPNKALSPCSGAAHVIEYNTMKTSSMRAQPGNVSERQVKIIAKRPAQDEVLLNTGKRPKPCPPPANAVSHMDVKAPDHSQMMVPQLPSTSSAVLTRISSDGGTSLFSTNSFMSSAVRPAEGHCPPQGAAEQNPAGVLQMPQPRPQHSVNQPGPHLGGNPYMKQQQEQQRQHLYHLQHHLTQPDPAQRHSLHQRALQQQQQEQHVQKKRGMVRGGMVRGSQTSSPAGLQQKQHHLEKSGLQQHQHQHQQHPQQSHQQSQPHQQPAQHQQSHPQQHQQQAHPQPPQAQHQQQQLQQQQQQQSSHSRHPQHLQQLQQQQHFRHQEKTCEGQSVGSRAHHSSHMAQQDHLKAGQDHTAMQRMMSSRSLEQQLISPPSNPVSRSSELACAPTRQERHRVSNYSAEALISKSSTSGEQQQRIAVHLQPGRGAAQEQADLRGYLDTARGKASIPHNPQNRLPSEHPAPSDVQRGSECQPFKVMGGGGGGAHQLGGFETQVSRGSDLASKPVPPSQRGLQGQQGGFRMSVGPIADGRNRGGYSGPHPGPQGGQVGSREQEGCHQSFMQSLLSPQLPEQNNHQRAIQCCPPVSMEYSCVSASSSGAIQAKASSPSVPQSQKAPAMRLSEGNKGHVSQVSGNMHTGVRAGLPHPPTPHSSSEPGRSRPPVSQHSRHLPRDTQSTKQRPSERPRSGTLRPTNPFEPEGHLPLPSGGGVLLGRPQSGGEPRRSAIVRFMADSSQVPGDNNLVSDQHLTQNFGFPFISEGGMNPPPPINANSTFIPPASQPSSSRTPSLLPVEPQNTLPSFYPSYSPAAHPSLPSDVTLQYFPNQMFTSPNVDKSSAPPLNNRFSSILSPPRPVGFGQAGFSLLPEMPPMPSSGITPHISNFSLTSLFPDIATGMPTDGSMPMSPLLSLSNTSSSDSGKQPNRPAHNISHILGHDGSSAV
ncbi:basic helix-loop-helix domain-containing protein USF3 [Nothobranchius furzeri]|uniref:Upstream transcription factor family member 3 n=2 Tax=Nothobranchius furzeri TaxID=105023 RepID=A0A8C6PML4_NOTFU|nr:upstream transcription factor family member 3 [Nothobranchius furzeri]